MDARTDSFTLVGRRMRSVVPPCDESMSIAEALRRVDLAIAQRRPATPA